jgi:predicted GIY-YIG superfamily endonuclease
MMHYTYVLLSEADGRFYIGATEELKRRMKEHGAGQVGTALG